jgi:hypothetical protein
MGCTYYRVQPTALHTLIEVILPCTHINTSLSKAYEAKSCKRGEFIIIPLGRRMVIGVRGNCLQSLSFTLLLFFQ